MRVRTGAQPTPAAMRSQMPRSMMSRSATQPAAAAARDSRAPLPFRKVLIANRGEIAVRVIRACRDLGLTSVAVYSDADRASLHVRMAGELGYPVLLKAAAGGGGKGIRFVSGPDELAAALRLAESEARQAFGDSTVYMEKAVHPARHIEVQIFGDTQGNVVHLGERECSIQRRHQKLIEESPSVAVDDGLRQRLTAAAVALAHACNYVNAGTVEFLLGPERTFYFLEVNTRLQVEHPVTEWRHRLGLVPGRLRVAAGLPLSF